MNKYQMIKPCEMKENFKHQSGLTIVLPSENENPIFYLGTNLNPKFMHLSENSRIYELTINRIFEVKKEFVIKEINN